MIKKKVSQKNGTTFLKNDKEDLFYLTPQEKKVVHICSQLYKIKSINRKKEYKTIELRKIVLNDPIGRKVLKELVNEGVNEEWLRTRGQERLADVFLSRLS